MEKLIKVGDVDRTFRANGATPIKYRKVFKGADFFKDLTSLKVVDLENMNNDDIERIEKIAFVMCEDSSKPGMSFESWLEQFSLLGLISALPEIVGLITDNIDTQNNGSSASKNGDPAES